nr:MAG TPA: hypothetical protein [Caudoviricetes sp.]
MIDVKNLVTYNTAIELKALGFNQLCTYYCVEKLEKPRTKGKKFNCISMSYPTDWNSVDQKSALTKEVIYPYVSIPTVYEAIRWIIKEVYKYFIHLTIQERLVLDELNCISIFEEISVFKDVLNVLIKILINGRKSIESKKTNQSYDKRK